LPFELLFPSPLYCWICSKVSEGADSLAGVAWLRVLSVSLKLELSELKAALILSSAPKAPLDTNKEAPRTAGVTLTTFQSSFDIVLNPHT
jgi:hypothetical protein